MKFTLRNRTDNKKTTTEYWVCFDSKRFEDACLSKYDNIEDAALFARSFNTQERLVMEHGGVHIERRTITKEVLDIEPK